jgi:hypothetical protein
LFSLDDGLLTTPSYREPWPGARIVNIHRYARPDRTPGGAAAWRFGSEHPHRVPSRTRPRTLTHPPAAPKICSRIVAIIPRYRKTVGWRADSGLHQSARRPLLHTPPRRPRR